MVKVVRGMERKRGFVSSAIGMATAAKLVSHKCTALVKVFRGTEPQSLH